MQRNEYQRKESYPKEFKGFGVDRKENWNRLWLVTYKAKELNPTEVCVKVEFCGLCGSDVHTLQGNWTPFRRKDLVVGHEIVGNIVAKGSKVEEFQLGDREGIGAACKSCQECKGAKRTMNNIAKS